jgi:Mitochondrial protein up-regulated during meiosis
VAALWTSPVAWGRVPVVGNVKLDILSERMVKNGDEKLIVRWKTCGKKASNGNHANGAAHDKITEWLSHLRPGSAEDSGTSDPEKDKEFVGLFIFEFDDQGRIASHTIEHADIGENWEAKTSRMISVTDWLLGRAWGKKGEEGGFALGYARLDQQRRHERLMGKRKGE